MTAGASRDAITRSGPPPPSFLIPTRMVGEVDDVQFTFAAAAPLSTVAFFRMRQFTYY